MVGGSIDRYRVLQRRLLAADSLVVDHGPLDIKMWMSNLEEEAKQVILNSFDHGYY